MFLQVNRAAMHFVKGQFSQIETLEQISAVEIVPIKTIHTDVRGLSAVTRTLFLERHITMSFVTAVSSTNEIPLICIVLMWWMKLRDGYFCWS